MTGAVSFHYQIGTLRSSPLSDPAYLQSKLVPVTRERRMLPLGVFGGARESLGASTQVRMLRALIVPISRISPI
jgi:hypothetical protein